jgi:hypothetical protein
VSTTALHIIELVKSLPLAEQRTICAELAKRAAALKLPLSEGESEKLEFAEEDYQGLDDDDPFFRVMEEIEAARHAYTGRPAPQLD